jgi:hypothetical protein
MDIQVKKDVDIILDGELVQLEEKEIYLLFDIIIYNNENYRIINISQGFTKPLKINIYDKKHKLIQSNINNPFDFQASHTGNFQIEFIVAPEDTKNVNKKCIAFSLGYK